MRFLERFAPLVFADLPFFAIVFVLVCWCVCVGVCVFVCLFVYVFVCVALFSVGVGESEEDNENLNVENKMRRFWPLVCFVWRLIPEFESLFVSLVFLV